MHRLGLPISNKKKGDIKSHVHDVFSFEGHHIVRVLG